MPEILNVPSGQTLHGITIKAVQMRNLQALATAVQPIVGDVLDAVEGRGDWLALVVDHTERMCEALRCCSDASAEQIAELPPDQFIELLAIAVELNTDFFIRRLMPAVRTRMESLRTTLGAAMQTGGTTPSPA